MHEAANNLRRITLRVSPQLHQTLTQAAGINEETLLRHVKEARLRIWQERYQQMT